MLPDLYIDALAFLPAWAETGPRLDAIAQRGGGNMPIGPVELKLGGNAANLAVAMARLGARVDLIAETDEVGRHLLDRAAVGTRLSTRLLRVGPRASVTLGLECDGANLMLSHAGPLTNFGPQRLTLEDWGCIEDADAVAVVNWSQNSRGTELLRAVAKRLRGSGTFLFVDTADPRHRLAELPALLAEPFWNDVGALGLNENELGAFLGGSPDDPIAAAQQLAQRLGTRLDLHTRAFAASVTAEASVRVKARGGKARRLTGAGDAWNAGNLAGELLGMQARDRLSFAHAVATRYVLDASGLPPLPEMLAPRPTRGSLNPKGYGSAKPYTEQSIPKGI